MHRLSFLLVAASMLGWPQTEPIVDPVRDWIAGNAIRLRTPEPRSGFDDLKPLKEVIRNARLVSLGEATHGTREFFQLKHRIVEFLVSEMGFTIFSIEANMPESYRMNAYVRHGNGDPKQFLNGMYFWTWNTQEVLDLVEWMHDFNKSGSGSVQFTGFDMQTPDVAARIVREFIARYDPEQVNDNDRLLASVRATRPTPRGAFGVATANFPVAAAAGKRLRYSGFIKSENIANGFAGLWWRVDGKTGILAFDNMASRGVTGTTDWTKHVIELAVPGDAVNINFGVLNTGSGIAWFDDLQVELDGVLYEDSTRFDLAFESDSPRGFYTGGGGYRVTLDKSAVHGGVQSLEIRQARASGENSADPKPIAAEWKRMIERLDTSGPEYSKQGVTASELAWIVQNARVVLQFLQMRGNEVSRDRSMAENIKWILDQSPKAKVVVWAHNAHVAKAGYYIHEPMGGRLKQMFGDQMVVFGFAFNQGSFRAVEPSKALRDFTVAPAPEGTLDAMLASTIIPLFALDLRLVPKTGPIAEWFSTPHDTRTIGAIYSEQAAGRFFASLPLLEAFDALLFVEKTTAARKVDSGSRMGLR